MANPRHVAATTCATLCALAAFACASERKHAEPPMQPASYEAPPTTTAEPKGLPANTPAEGDPLKSEPGEPEAPDTMGPQAPAPPQ